MRKILILLGLILFAGFDMAYACDTNQIDVLGDGTQCETAKFTITTTELVADTEFKFYMSARGTFYVDWGDGTIDTITRTNTTETLYDHTYTTAGVKTIRFGGLATGYGTGREAAIRFYTGTISYGYVGSSTSVSTISGSLGAIFPTLGTTQNKQPVFKGTFMNAQIQNIPENLFSGVSGASPYRFSYTFASCRYLTSIPGNLFFGLSGAAEGIFAYTFYNCIKITSIPENLFAGIRGAAYAMFSDTFGSCTGLTSIPGNLFSGVSGGANHMFAFTFSSCIKLTSIPAGLFSGITTGATEMFSATFQYCTGLTSIPADLFSSITTAAKTMFSATFKSCTNLSGYIPPSTFAGLIAKGSPTESTMWRNTFSNTKLVKSCPAGTVQYTTGYEGTDTTNYTKWNGYVSCVDENLVCEMGEYLPAHWYQCEQCPENNYCVGGTYPYSETITSGITQCASGLYSPSGMWESAQCGRILHVGDGFVYLRATKKTSPALHLDLDHDGVADYFGNMTTLDVPMSRDTQRKLKVRYNNTTYSIYDDSVELPTE